MARSNGHMEKRVRVSAQVQEALFKRAAESGRSVETCARHAVLDLARGFGVALPGGTEVNVFRGDPREGPVLYREHPTVWVSYPAGWMPGIRQLVGEINAVREDEVWRRALNEWLERGTQPDAERAPRRRGAKPMARATKPAAASAEL